MKTSSSTALSSAATSMTPTAQVNVGLSSPRLIPPSEKQDNHALPSNIFVTSVDVEEGLLSKKKWKKWQDTCANDEGIDESKIWLDYGAETPKDTVTVPGQDFERAEKEWESFQEITELYQLKLGAVVGWKALAINPSTFTPEMLLNLAIVNSCNDKEVIVRPLHRPGAAQISFGGILEHEEDVAEESYEWPDIISAQWRVVNTGT